MDRCSSSSLSTSNAAQEQLPARLGWKICKAQGQTPLLGKSFSWISLKTQLEQTQVFWDIEKVWLRPYSTIHLPPKGTLCVSTFRISIMLEKLNSLQSHSEKGTFFPNRATSWGLWCSCWRNLVEEIKGKKRNHTGTKMLWNRGNIWTQNLSNRIPKFNFPTPLSCYGIKKKKTKRQKKPQIRQTNRSEFILPLFLRDHCGGSW